MSRISSLFAAPLLVLALGVAGCAAPCDRYCDTVASYIDGCLADSQADWVAANEGGGWATWGSTGPDEYAADCREDLAEQLAGPAGATGLSQACEDDANRYQELADRGLCADLP